MAGTWTSLQTQTKFNASTMLLLTDGTVICQDDNQAQWYKFTPDRSGSYIAGTWSAIAAMSNARKFFASQVLTDGRVLVVGAEYFMGSNTPNNTNTAEIYDPVADQWSNVAPGFSWIQGDAPSCMLANGQILYGSLNSQQTAIYDPTAGTWRETGVTLKSTHGQKSVRSDEESWVLLPDGSVLTVNVASIGAAEKFVPSLDGWVPAVGPGSALPVTLVDSAGSEIGPAILLTNGRAFFIGATGHTALYTPPSSDASQPGTWAAGPDIKDSSSNGTLYTVIDGPACLLPNGKVLLGAGLRHPEKDNPSDVNSTISYWSGPIQFFEFDPVSNTITKLADNNQPANASGNTWQARLLLLPTGQVMFTNTTNQVSLYTPDGSWDPSWQPTILNWNQPWLQAGQTYTVEGTQLNGLSQAVGYGDDYSAATNYPLVRLAFNDSGNLYYCRTLAFSTMGVATGAALHNFKFEVPNTMTETGEAVMIVSVNGISAEMIQIPVIPKTFQAPSPAIVTSLTRYKDHMDVFVTGLEGGVYSTYWDAKGNWYSDWFRLGDDHFGDNFTIPQGAATTPLTRYPDHMDLFVVGRDGAVYSTYWDAKTDWFGHWFRLGDANFGDGFTVPPGSTVSALARYPDHMDLFVVGRDEIVYTTFWDAKGNWFNHWFRA